MSYDSKCMELAVYFFGPNWPSLHEIAQAIQDTVESFPVEVEKCSTAQNASKDDHG